jgi:hypothetical protein
MSEEVCRVPTTGRLLNLTGVPIMFWRKSGCSEIPPHTGARFEVRLGAAGSGRDVRSLFVLDDGNDTTFPVYERYQCAGTVVWHGIPLDTQAIVVHPRHAHRLECALRNTEPATPFDVYTTLGPNETEHIWPVGTDVGRDELSTTGFLLLHRAWSQSE